MRRRDGPDSARGHPAGELPQRGAAPPDRQDPGRGRRERGTPPEETAMDLIVEDDSRIGTVRFTMSEDNVRKKIALPWVTLLLRLGSIAPEPPFTNAQPHPRSYGIVRPRARQVRPRGETDLARRGDPPADRSAGQQLEAVASAAARRRATSPMSWSSIPRPSSTGRPSRNRTSSPKASSTCSSTAARCCATASTPEPSPAASSGDRDGEVK